MSGSRRSRTAFPLGFALALLWVGATDAAAAASSHRMCLRTFLNRGYVQILPNGAVRAAGRGCSRWETLTVIDHNGGPLRSGERVWIRIHTGRYLRAHPNGHLDTAVRPGPWETFQVRGWRMHNGTVLGPGARVFFGSAHRKYLIAIGGGGREVRAHALRAATWESFIVTPVAAERTPPKLVRRPPPKRARRPPPKRAVVRRAVVRRRESARETVAPRAPSRRAGAVQGPKQSPPWMCPADAYADTGPKKFKGKIGQFFQKVYDSITGRWDFRKHPAPRSPRRIRAAGKPTLCYRALGYGPATLVRGLPNPDRENQKFYRREQYSLRKMAGDLFGSLGDLLQQGVGMFKDWAKNKLKDVKQKVKTFVKEKIVGAISAAVCKAKCAWTAKSWCGLRPCLDQKEYDACKRQRCGLGK